MRVVRSIAALLTVAVFHLLFACSGVIQFADYRLLDLLLRLEVSETTNQRFGSIVVVEIDEASLKEFGQWPWPRFLQARVLEEVLRQRPAAVGYDIFFPERDRTSPRQIKEFYRKRLGIAVSLGGFPPGLDDHDLVFAQVLRSGPTVLPLFVVNKTRGVGTGSLPSGSLIRLPAGFRPLGGRAVVFNTPLLQQAARGFGFINAGVDSDGVLRRQSLILGSRKYPRRGVPALALALLAQLDLELKLLPPVHFGAPYCLSFLNKTIALNRRGEVLNLYYGPESFQRISASKLLQTGVPPDLFTGKLVLIGATAAGLYDQYVTSSGRLIPGVYAHASLVENLLRQRGTYYQPLWAGHFGLLLSALLSLLVISQVIRHGYLLSWMIYLFFSTVSVFLAVALLNRGIYISLGSFLAPFSAFFFLISLFFSGLHYVERKRFLEELGEAHSATIDSMTMVAESRDVETGSHILRTKEYVVILARTLRENGIYKERIDEHFIDLLYRAAPLHDIGKVGIVDAILRKPGRLTREEFEIMKKHVTIGCSVIENAINSYNKTNEFLTVAANIARCHHERWDGGGYPTGLSGEEIPLEARLMALADVYDALISHRCYKEAIPFAEAETMIVAEEGKHFDPLIVWAFRLCREDLRRVACISCSGCSEREFEVPVEEYEQE